MNRPFQHIDYRIERKVGFDPNVERFVAPAVCFVFGHEVVPDHCGIPEHDYCVWCGKSVPFGASADCDDCHHS